MVDDDWRTKSPDASRTGTAVEYLVAATCILASCGELNVSTALVDDEDVDVDPTTVMNRLRENGVLTRHARPATSPRPPS